jgi:peptidoglycan hydrolase CwlO-like protein
MLYITDTNPIDIFLYLPKLNTMKNIIILAIACLALSSCSNMESDAEKACDFTTQIMEMMPQMIELSMKAGFGDEDSKEEAQKKLDELQASLEKMSEEMESIKGKYDEEEFQAYLLENCEGAKEMLEMGKAIEAIGDIKL